MRRLPSHRKNRVKPHRSSPRSPVASRRQPSVARRWLTWSGRVLGLGLSAIIVLGLSGLVFILVGTDWLYARLLQQPEIWLVTSSQEVESGGQSQVALVRLSQNLSDTRWLSLPSQVSSNTLGRVSQLNLYQLSGLANQDESGRIRLSQTLAQPLSQVIVLSNRIDAAWWNLLLDRTPIPLRVRLLLVLTQRASSAQELKETDLIRLSALLRKHLTQPDDLARACAMTVVNTTTERGLAALVGSWLESSGGYVARLLDEKSPRPTTLIVQDESSQAECQHLVDQAKLFLPTTTTQAVARDVKAKYRTPIVVMLGADLSATMQVSQ